MVKWCSETSVSSVQLNIDNCVFECVSSTLPLEIVHFKLLLVGLVFGRRQQKRARSGGATHNGECGLT